jgi:cyclopropane fatty-acyl-phospholipid synthase-like methyltransferase
VLFSPAGLKLQDKIISACRQYSNLSQTHVSKPHRLIDLGSGDGCLVIAATKELGSNVHGVGVELNPWLVWYSRYQAARAGVSKQCSFQVKDLWATDLSQFDTIVVCGVPDMMETLGSRLREQMKPDAILIAGRFKLATWTPSVTLVGDSGSEAVDGVWVYRKQ